MKLLDDETLYGQAIEGSVEKHCFFPDPPMVNGDATKRAVTVWDPLFELLHGENSGWAFLFACDLDFADFVQGCLMLYLGRASPSHRFCTSMRFTERCEFLQPSESDLLFSFEDSLMSLATHTYEALKSLRPHVETIGVRKDVVLLSLNR